MSASRPLNVVVCWHMHQPWYRESQQGDYRLPWVYLHALKDYVDMAAHLEAHPKMRCVVNFTPVLLEQLAKWGDADVIIYLGCGERGNELADLIEELREIAGKEKTEFTAPPASDSLQKAIERGHRRGQADLRAEKAKTVPATAEQIRRFRVA